MTTIIRGDSLWATAWLNVLPKPAFNALAGNPAKGDPGDTFPWLAPCRTSDKKTGAPTTPPDVHPLQMLWGMPRRIRLDFDQTGSGSCELCGADTDTLARSYLTKNYGVNYEGAWQHPLSPYGRNKEGMPLARHPQPGGLVYRHWLGLVVHDQERDIRPAAVVTYYYSQRSRRLVAGQQGSRAPKLWCFGYDTDNMKARCWYESSMPLVSIEKKNREQYEIESSRLVKAADYAAFLLRANLKKAWYANPKGVKGDLSFVDSRFWQETETSFYGAVDSIARSLRSGENTDDLRRQWLHTLRDKALEIFDELSQTGSFDAVDPKRIALSRRDLRLSLSQYAKKICDLLVLPRKQRAA